MPAREYWLPMCTFGRGLTSRSLRTTWTARAKVASHELSDPRWLSSLLKDVDVRLLSKKNGSTKQPRQLINLGCLRLVPLTSTTFPPVALPTILKCEHRHRSLPRFAHASMWMITGRATTPTSLGKVFLTQDGTWTFPLQRL